MKRIMKFLALTLTVAMLCSVFAGCELLDLGPKTAKELFAKSAEVMKKDGDGFHMDADVDMELKVKTKKEIEGVKIDLTLPISLEMAADVYKEDVYMTAEVKASIDAKMDANGETQTMDEEKESKIKVYAVKDDDEYVLYTNTDGNGWYTESSEESGISFDNAFNFSEDEDMEKVLENAKMEKTDDGYEVTFKFVDLLSVDGVADALKDIDTGDIDIDEDVLEYVKDMFEDVELKYVFDKKYHPVRFYTDEIELDLVDIIARWLETSTDIAGGDFDKEMLKDLKASAVFKFDLKLSEFGEVEEDDVKAPKKVVEEAEENGPAVDNPIVDEPIIDEPVIDEPVIDEPVIDEPQVTEPEILPTEPAETNPSQGPNPEVKPTASDVSDDWKVLDVAIDGVTYHFPYDYKKLQDDGWSFDMADYGHEDGYILNKGEKTYSTISLSNKDKYGDEYNSFKITVGFQNFGDSAVDITECDIWSMKLDCEHGWNLMSNYPEVAIAKGIHFGSTEADVLAAFGEPDDTYVSEDYGYKTFEYVNNYSEHLRFSIDDEHGVTSIELQKY